MLISESDKRLYLSFLCHSYGSIYLKLKGYGLPEVFTTEEARFFLQKRYKAPLKILSSMEKSGEIVRLRRGLYAFAEGFDCSMAASRIYGPSYLSFETALAFYGLIPERVHQMISVVDGRPARFLANAVRYIYHSQDRQLFSLGMGLVFIQEYPVPMAIPEKALLDTLAVRKLEASQLSENDVLEFVIGNLRVDEEDLQQLSLYKMKKMANLYRNLAPRKLVKALSKGGGSK